MSGESRFEDAGTAPEGQLEEIERVLAAGSSRAVCQPIVSLSTADILGYEALTRPDAEAPLDSPASFLAAASRHGLAAEVDDAWRNASVSRFGPVLAQEHLLFLNCSPSSLMGGQMRASALQAMVRRHGIAPERIVLEITEEQAIEDFDEMRRVLSGFRSHGFLLAIDDAGAGQSSLQSTVELRPNFIKLDRWLSRDIEFDRARRSMVEAITGFAHQMRARVVAEGMETPEQVEAFIELGVDFGQGFVLGRPAALPKRPEPKVVALIRQLNSERRKLRVESRNARVGDLATLSPTTPPQTPGAAILEQFQENALLDVLPVLGPSGVVGIITRGRIFERMSGHFGLSLNEKRPASQLCVPATTVASTLSARTAARIALSRPPVFQQDPLVVLEGDAFAGVVGMSDLMQQLLTEEVAEARLSNPLTGLPGNRVIRRQIETLVSADAPYFVLYADIDTFKTFNDEHGFAHGDSAILGLGTVLTEAAKACRNEAFVGHVGGDDFVVLVHEGDLPAMRHLIERGLAGRWFDPEGKLGEARLTCSIGGGPLSDAARLSYEEMAAVVAQVKRALKLRGGNRFEVFESLVSALDAA
jgi:diguanylate cyclase (GGDEF)-like protein